MRGSSKLGNCREAAIALEFALCANSVAGEFDAGPLLWLLRLPQTPKRGSSKLGNCRFAAIALEFALCANSVAGESGAAVVLKSWGYFSMVAQVMSSGKSVFADYANYAHPVVQSGAYIP
jgi:hypothetical protein